MLPPDCMRLPAILEKNAALTPKMIASAKKYPVPEMRYAITGAT